MEDVVGNVMRRAVMRSNPYLEKVVSKEAVLIGVAFAGLVGSVVMPVQAHHSFPATYRVDEQVTIQGTVKSFVFRNPHSFLHVEAPDKDGKMVPWAVEWGSGQALAGQGVSASTLKPGDKVIITGNPARDTSSHRLRMSSVERPSDGWKWSGTFG